ncbi:MAG: pentapeptide repeat-containing protein [Bacteroidota bacterium]
MSICSFSQNDPGGEASEVDSLKIYQTEKLKQEIAKLESENSASPLIKNFPTYAGLLTAFVGVVGAIIAFLRYLKERRNETAQRARENQIRLEAKFDAIIKNLGSENASLQASASVSLRTFLKPEYRAFHHQVYLILLANLKTKLPSNVNTLMVNTFEKALRLNLKAFENQGTTSENGGREKLDLDLSRTRLRRIDLQGLNLENVDLAFADLEKANLKDCNLKRAKGFSVNLSGAYLSGADLSECRFNEANMENAQLHGSTLLSAKLKNAKLIGAEFQQAKLQDAHLDEAQIYGAQFQYANLNNTYFKKIKYSDSDLNNIKKSKNESWRKANFDDEVYNKLNKK